MPQDYAGANARWQLAQSAVLSGEHRLSEFIHSPNHDPLVGESLPIPLGESEFYPLQILALGHPYAVDNCRLRLHKLGYAVRAAFPKEAPNDWSIPLPIIRSTEVIRAARPGDVMRVLTKRIAKP